MALKPSSISILLRSRLSVSATTRVTLDQLKNMDPFQETETLIDQQSSQSKPMVLTAYGSKRAIMCVCKDVNYLMLEKGPPMQCKCGHWFQLVDAKKFWL